MPNPYNPDQDRANRSNPDQSPGSNPAHPGEYHKGDAAFQIPWWVILVLFFMGAWPVALILILLNQLLRQGTLPDPRTVRDRHAGAARSSAAGTPVYAQPQKTASKAAPPPQTARAAYDPEQTAKADERKDGDTAANILLIAGIIATAIGAVALTTALVDLVAYGIPGGFAAAYLEDIVSGIIPLVGGLGMLFGSHKLKAGRRMRKKIENIVGRADHVSIQEIADAIPCSYDKCCRYLEDCIDKGVFGDNAYLDMRTGSLVVRGAPPAPKAQPAPPDPQPAGKSTEASRYNDILVRLRKINDAIPDAAMSDKISRLEAVSAKIFLQAEQNPDKLPQMRKFMDYYLPTALKLLETYAELQAQGIEGENITESKHRIESAMDTLVTAFEAQLDKLFQDDALDVSTDIDVMENMLRADGLTGDCPGPRLQL